MNFKRRSRPGSVEHGISRLAGELARTDLSFAVMLFVEGQPLPGFEFSRSRRLYVFVKAGNENPTLRIFQFADDLNQREKRIRRRTPVHAGVQISLRSNGFNFGIDQPAQPNAQGREIGRE